MEFVQRRGPRLLIVEEEPHMVAPENQGLHNPQCPRCARPMRLIGGMPQTTNLPRLDSYRCEACNEVCVLEDRRAHK